MTTQATHRHTDQADAPCLLITVEEAARRLRIGRTTAYALIAEGRLRTVQIGRCRRVPTDSLTAFVEALKIQSDGTATVRQPSTAQG